MILFDHTYFFTFVFFTAVFMKFSPTALLASLPLSPCLTTNTVAKVKSLSLENEEGKNDVRSRICACQTLACQCRSTHDYIITFFASFMTDLLVSFFF